MKIKPNSNGGDGALLCVCSVNISEWLSHILLASTLFFGQPCGEGLHLAGRRLLSGPCSALRMGALAGGLLPACFISKRRRRGGSHWNRPIPADLSGEVEKRHFYQGFTLDSLASKSFYRGPHGLGRLKWAHRCSGGAGVNGKGGKGEGEQSTAVEEEMPWLAGAPQCDSILL